MRLFFGVTFVVLFLVLVGLQVTSDASARPGVVTLTWVTDDNPVRQQQMALFRHWYQQKYHAPIDIRIDPANSGRAKIVVQTVAGNGPDVFDYGGDEGLSYVESGILLDVTDAAQRDGFGADHFWPVLKSGLSMGGRIYGVPDNASRSLILVNEDMLKAAGVPMPPEDWKWADLVRLGQALTQRDAHGRIVRFGLLAIDWRDLVVQNGGTFFTPSGARCIINQPNVVEALQFYEDLKKKYRVMPSAAETTGMAAQGGYGAGDLNLFLSGRAAMISFGRYGYISINIMNAERAAENLAPLSIIPTPPLRQKQPVGIAFGRYSGVNSMSKHPVEATRFLEFLSTREFNDLVNRCADSVNAVPQYAMGPSGLTGGRPPVRGCDDPVWARAIVQGVSPPTSRFLRGTLFDTITTEELDRLDNDLQDPSETAARIERRTNDAIADYLQSRPDLRREWTAINVAENGSGP